MDSWQSPHGRALPPLGQRTLIMGVLNVTPDSFSDGGSLPNTAAIVERAGKMIEAGADVLDLGGESTRPHAEPVSAELELTRIIPALEAVRRTWPHIPISIDSYKAQVADAALQHGADLVNDVWALTHDISVSEWSRWRESIRDGSAAHPPHSQMAAVVSRWRCPVILMHNRRDRNYADFWNDVLLDLKASQSLALEAGVAASQIWLDPGFGFAKEVPQNLEVLRDLRRIVSLGHPVLVGTSRKSTIGRVLGVEVQDRLEGGAATLAWAIQQGCRMVRVHDVPEMARVVRMADAIKAGLAFSPPIFHG
jgi:dihydropteroate synthase